MFIQARVDNLRVGKKLVAGFALLVVLALAIAIFGINTMGKYRDRSLIVAMAADAETQFLSADNEMKNFLLGGDAQALRDAGQKAELVTRKVRELMEFLMVPADDARAERIIAGVGEYRSLLNSLDTTTKNSPDALLDLQDQLLEVGEGIRTTANELQTLQLEKMGKQYDAAITTMSTISLIAVLFSVSVAWVLTRSITTPIRQSVGIASRVASGDLTVQVEKERGDEFGELFAAFGTMVTSLRDLIGKIDGGAGNIASSAEELSAVTDQTSAGVAQQRDQTDQVATAMNEMVATVNDVARSAESAFRSASEASSKSEEGEHAVGETLDSVTRLNRQIGEAVAQVQALQGETRNIGVVLDVIKSVAEQTNLLALNAAIEAARAGEQGRGFAVVADEVRSLAKRTQSSALEIETLITTLVSSAEASVSTMESGAKLGERTLERAETAGATIREMAAAVEEIRQYNSQIATAAEQQTSVAEEINRNITQIRDGGDQSAASAEQVSGASDELARLAEGLNAQVARFRVA